MSTKLCEQCNIRRSRKDNLCRKCNSNLKCTECHKKLIYKNNLCHSCLPKCKS